MIEGSRTVYLATSNEGKFREAAEVTAEFGIKLKQLKIMKVEIQSHDLIEIASHAAGVASKATGLPIVTDDSGLFVNILNGFPGPYSSYVLKTIGLQGILRLMPKRSDRRSFFRSAVAFSSPSRRHRAFTGIVKGLLTTAPKGKGGFGFDPIFKPDHGDGRTFAQMTLKEKNSMSHRAIAFRKFAEWYARP